uniref:BHLH domain-containing protein n=1 Tax=Chenopodium quinoa TaxID=63459 RepID=A0A803LLI2_CHEQI
MMSNSAKSIKSSSTKRDRKTVEKDRRNTLKILYSELNTLIPRDDASSPKAIPDQIDDATNYIKQLKSNIENLKQTRDNILGVGRVSSSRTSYYSKNSPVQIEVRLNGSALLVTLITGLECQFVFTEAIRILHEENIEVVNANYCVTGNIVLHTIHAQIGEAVTTDTVARITQRLKKFEL